MSSFAAKKVVRTYSRQNKRSLYDEPPTKRRRVETAVESIQAEVLIPLPVVPAKENPSPLDEKFSSPPSSPKEPPAIFSDALARSSPPSSPTPRSSPPPLQKRRPVFSIFKKQSKATITINEPLIERDQNAQSPPKPPKKKHMVQMQLDLASETRKTCKTCGMQYIPSNLEDAALHKKFHAINFGGMDFTKALIQRLKKNEIWNGSDGSFIAVVGRKDALLLRRRASDVLKIVNTELAAVSISDEELWSQKCQPVNTDTVIGETVSTEAEKPATDKLKSALVDRFKVYLYIRGSKCVGACLAERIWEAFQALGPDAASEQSCKLPDTTQSSSISISNESDPAILGISRIWTSNQHRKKGIATRLLDCARANFLYGMRIEKAKVAFSQPTESGGNLARKCNCLTVLEDAAAPTKTKKSVRIVSPTTTIPPPPNFDDDNNVTLNELMARRASHGGRPASPPPPVNPAGFANHSITAGEANAQVIGKDALVTAGALPSTRTYLSGSQGAFAPGNAPANPFSKTLASLEPQLGEGGTEELTNAQRPKPGNNRASLDVESFKNLLMTGVPTPRASGQSARPGSASYSTSSAQFESSSTDSSSVSRQSISEHPQEIHAESSRTSDEVADEDEDEGVGMVPEMKKSKKQPPPAPKHRHGKLVAPRQPQTVPFDQFEATEPVAPASISRTSSSDASKPLPSSPMAQQQQSPQQSRPTPPKPSDAPKSAEDPAKPKKTPPPVPIARRHSQLKTTTPGNRSRSSSNLTVSSQHSIEAPQTPTLTYHDPMSSAKSPPPPPPPSRYGARLANLGASSTNSSSTELAQSSSSARIPRSIPDPPSPRRNALDSEAPSRAPSMHRTSSVSSTRNAQRNVSGGSTGSTMPPPPPPRRRQSNRSSLDQQRPYPYSSTSPTESRRTSTEHRRTSVASESSLRRAYAPVDEKGENEHALYSPVDEKERVLGVDESANAGTEKGEELRSNSSNILDDMEKFQREIDELRTRYK
ncbi:hypothetical protein COCC4DRAFT_73271 [Bipolaris maydis ATCC 48331]|nr:uncharacterized protein COCC4DRAFT_73271 [Bipolaris maydis ATCC 48331]ENI03576.1 hypothetical protein COCC4DRAFT_73271 [Bipolaris maydis ATCC 48331]KAJ5031404.1 hypothetical protein J3E73DRAFT_428559 [Bipolaris maydis]KAJ6273733.1 hypothetical protein PSV08DRAFT_408064 [Bipolaris maydis]